LKKEAKRIPVQFEGSPVVTHIPVLHDTSITPANSTTVQRERITVTPSARSEPDDGPSLEDWADYFWPSIEGLLPSFQHSFVPKVVSIERETFYRDQQEGAGDDLPEPSRLRVTRRKVTMVGTVQHG
jgi:hypothetical protein